MSVRSFDVRSSVFDVRCSMYDTVRYGWDRWYALGRRVGLFVRNQIRKWRLSRSTQPKQVRTRTKMFLLLIIV